MESPPFPPPAALTALSLWRTRLQPFLDALQFKLRVDVPPLPTRDELQSVFVSVNYFATETFQIASWSLMLEALELLDLLVCVDGDVGWSLLLEVADVDRVFRINEASLFDKLTTRPQFAFELEDGEMQIQIVPALRACRTLCDVDHMPQRSSAFLEVEQELLTAWREQHDRKRFTRTTHGRIPIKPRLRIDDVHVLLRAAYELDQLSESMQQARLRWAMMDDTEKLRVTNPFVASSLDIMLLCSNGACEEIIEALINVARRNVTISNLVIHPALLDCDSADVLFFKLLRPTSSSTALSRLELTSGELNENGIYNLCTTLAQSRGVEEFVLGGSGDRTDHHGWLWAPWLAYALFRANATHDIRSVTLHVEGLEARDVQAMRDVLEHPNPLDFLSSGCVDHGEPGRHVEWTSVSSPIKNLTLDYVNPTSRPAMLELLRLVGASLERLTLKQYGMESFSYEFMDAVLLHCPNLKWLSIAEAGVSLDWLYARPQDGKRRALPESLVLEGRMENPTAVDFFRTLGRVDHPLTKTLRQVHCSLWRTRQPPLEMVDAWLDMLDTNRVLERSEIVMSEKGASAYQLAKYRERFEAHDGERLADPNTLAFLSVVSPSSTSTTAVPLQLGVDALQLILEFARPAKRRICG